LRTGRLPGGSGRLARPTPIMLEGALRVADRPGFEHDRRESRRPPSRRPPTNRPPTAAYPHRVSGPLSDGVSRQRRGILAGVAAYGLWGLFPLYWPLLEPAGAVEILGHRVLWSLIFLLGVVTVRHCWPSLRALSRQPRAVSLLTLAAIVIAVNWGIYIWGVNSGHVLDTSLGYFINPLVTVLLGVVLLAEPLRRLQWMAVGFGTLAVLVLGVEYGRPPWIALALAFTFATYGFLKKKVNAGAVETQSIETAVIVLPAAGYLVALAATGRGSFGTWSIGHSLLLMGAGVVTAVPLLCFGAAATRVPLTTLGLLQYLTPSMQFLLGAFLRHEPLPAGRLAGFALVWCALGLLTVDLIRHTRGSGEGSGGRMWAEAA
jgi:chloramphenicol-sensitive protein RarD